MNNVRQYGQAIMEIKKEKISQMKWTQINKSNCIRGETDCHQRQKQFQNRDRDSEYFMCIYTKSITVLKKLYLISTLKIFVVWTLWSLYTNPC